MRQFLKTISWDFALGGLYRGEALGTNDLHENSRVQTHFEMQIQTKSGGGSGTNCMTQGVLSGILLTDLRPRFQDTNPQNGNNWVY